MRSGMTLLQLCNPMIWDTIFKFSGLVYKPVVIGTKWNEGRKRGHFQSEKCGGSKAANPIKTSLRRIKKQVQTTNKALVETFSNFTFSRQGLATIKFGNVYLPPIG